jgi:hypothetical protein
MPTEGLESGPQDAPTPRGPSRHPLVNRKVTTVAEDTQNPPSLVVEDTLALFALFGVGDMAGVEGKAAQERAEALLRAL